MVFKSSLGAIVARIASTVFTAGALAALASCGGGTYQQQSFRPARLLVFGDESSRLEGPQGVKYSINGVSSTTREVDCTANPIWTQWVADSFGMVFANCNVNASNDVDAFDLTTVGGTVGDVVSSVAAFQAGDTFNGSDLVTVWVGMNDIVDEYRANGNGDRSALLQDMKERGRTLAGVVNAIAAAGGKVVLLTVPDMSESPFAWAEYQRGDFDRLRLLSDMSTAFNLGLRINIVNDGSEIALVTVDDMVRDAYRGYTSRNYIPFDNQVAGCRDSAPLPTCTDDTLQTDPANGQPPVQPFLWADATHLGAAMQGQIGAAARDKAHSNPL